MPDEIDVTLRTTYPSGYLYAILEDANATLTAWQFSTDEFSNYISQSPIDDWGINLTNVPISGDVGNKYVASIPITVPQRLLNVKVKGRSVNGAGGEAVHNDENIASGVLAWGGATVGLVFTASFQQIEATLTELDIIKTSLDELYDLVLTRCGEQETSGESGGGGSSSDGCENAPIDYDSFKSLITAAKSITVDGMIVEERSLTEVIAADKYLASRRAACANRGNAWGSLGRSRAVPPDATGRC
jgi:hypothetical protein